MSDWPEPVERVSEFVRRAAVEARIEEFPAGTKTAEDAARAVGCDVAQIVKSLVFLCDGKPVLVMIGGDRRADSAKVAASVPCEKAKIAGSDDVRRATGFDPGAVAPFPLPGIETVLVDDELLLHEVVWTGAGSHSHVLAIAPSDLVRVTRARSVDAVAEDS
ncbi:MAG TPA: YbaK/EbsC family protein [Gaiellaceae bacterium]|jgi:prolyl-tRNA editing enzyme YbaK/EbsC (Cys-tRNA(Pro) deacylase)